MKRLVLALLLLCVPSLLLAQPGGINVNDKVLAGTVCPPVNQPGGGTGTLYTCTGTGAVYTWTGSSWVAVGGGAGTIGGTIALNQVAYGSAADEIQGSASLTYDGTSLTATGKVVTDTLRTRSADILTIETPSISAGSAYFQFANSSGENSYLLKFPGSGYIFSRDNGVGVEGEINIYQDTNKSRILLYNQVEFFSGSGGANFGFYGETGSHASLTSSNSAVQIDIGATGTPLANLYLSGTLRGTELNVTQLPTPSAPTITNVGTPGATTYSYKVVAYTATSTDHSPASANGTTATGNATLNGSNYNHIVITPINGATIYYVYRTVGGATQGLISAVGVSVQTLTFDDTGIVADGSTAPTTNTTGVLYGTNSVLSRNGIGATSTDGLVIQNTTAAAAGAQQWSPRLHFSGQGWKTDATAASQSVDWIIQAQPVQGSSAPTVNLLFSRSVNGGAYGATVTIDSSGRIQAGSDGSAGAVAFASNGDSRTGFYRDGSGNFAIGVGGTTAMTASGTGVITPLLSVVSPLYVGSGSGLTVANVGANSCGTTAATIAGGPNSFEVTVGATSGTQCRVAFPAAAPNRYNCSPTNSTTGNLVRSTFVDTTHVDLTGTFVAGDVLSVVCISR